jgi:hypothetical protein
LKIIQAPHKQRGGFEERTFLIESQTQMSSVDADEQDESIKFSIKRKPRKVFVGQI